MSETKDTSLFTEITAEESASVNGAHYYGSRYDRYSRRGRGCNRYSYSPYFDGRQVDSYVRNYGYGRGYYN